MPYLLRVELPDVPGSLGRLASAVGEAGGDIEAIEIVEKRHDGTAVDDVLLEMIDGIMPDSIVSACNALDGVSVVWISRYAAGGNLFLDLEAVEDLTAHPAEAINRLVDLLPMTFRSDWALRLHRVGGVVHATGAAPDELGFVDLDRATRLESDDDTLYAAARLDGNEIVVIGRRGGPEFLDSEIARLGHLTGLALSIARVG
ncbi:ACT domain-containing protein [Nocardioides sp.]|uniref:ACT domain-containing protein n=1 Tax=Nocardioides sp. TaxID=35761 RepID=UPI00286CD7DF|nr:ACT domain-containing protein [Nocardioides sp.]